MVYFQDSGAGIVLRRHETMLKDVLYGVGILIGMGITL